MNNNKSQQGRFFGEGSKDDPRKVGYKKIYIQLNQSPRDNIPPHTHTYTFIYLYLQTHHAYMKYKDERKSAKNDVESVLPAYTYIYIYPHKNKAKEYIYSREGVVL